MAQRPYGYYTYQNEVEELITLIPGQQYNFTIKDIYGDGITNKGWYQIVTSSDRSILVISDGMFGRERHHTFDVPFEVPSMETSVPSSVPSDRPSMPPSLHPTPYRSTGGLIDLGLKDIWRMDPPSDEHPAREEQRIHDVAGGADRLP